LKQSFVSIDIANASDESLIEEEWFENPFPAEQMLNQPLI
jgi:hypothetical protein